MSSRDCIRCVIIPITLFVTTIQAAFPYGELNDALYAQRLSHMAFHSNRMKGALVSLVSADHGSVAVVGVEWGSEVEYFAENGYHVYAFEPLSRYVKFLQERMQSNPVWNVTLVPIAAGSKRRGKSEIVYDNEGLTETVVNGVLDDHVLGELDVLSIDIQGNEYDVLLGAERLLGGPIPRIKSLWIEAIACNEKVKNILSLLDKDYVLFDFVPWGQAAAAVKEQVPRSLSSFRYLVSGRPSTFDKYWEWLCQSQKENFRWLQTDLVAIRRDILTHKVLGKIHSLASNNCGKQHGRAQCLLRELTEPNTNKDEL